MAITYYSTGVLGYVCKAADKLGLLPVPQELALGMSVPLIAVDDAEGVAVRDRLDQLDQHARRFALRVRRPVANARF